MSSKRNASPRRWGRVSVKPSEYMIKLRRGRVVAHGVGMSSFIWPWHSYTVLPTSIQRVTFVADQVTAERTGVAVTGIAVYRIADPLLAFRLLDFSDGERAAERLGEILRDMFVGASRRLVASMSVEECLTRRKEGIALELMREIRPVVSGEGRPDDATDQGWGLVIDTIEIQDVRILSETVFSELQAPYRAMLKMRARQSQVQSDQEVHVKEVDASKQKLEADLTLQQRQAAADEQARVQTLERQERLQLAELESKRRTAAAETEAELEQRERAAQLAQAEHRLARHRLELESGLAQLRGAAELELEQVMAEGKGRVAERQVQTERLRGELKYALARQAREVENLLSEGRIRYELVVNAVPALAAALAQCAGKVNLTQINGAGQGGSLAQTLAQLLAVARGAGVDFGGEA